MLLLIDKASHALTIPPAIIRRQGNLNFAVLSSPSPSTLLKDMCGMFSHRTVSLEGVVSIVWLRLLKTLSDGRFSSIARQAFLELEYCPKHDAPEEDFSQVDEGVTGKLFRRPFNARP